MRSDLETIVWFAREILPLHQRDWLLKAIDILKLDFQQIGETIPEDILIIVDYPDRDISHNWLGLYRRYEGLTHRWIFINPSVGGLLALDILVHELVHTIVGDKHDERFLEVAKAIGLDNTGPYAGAEEVLLERLRDIKETLGKYPTVGDTMSNPEEVLKQKFDDIDRKLKDYGKWRDRWVYILFSIGFLYLIGILVIIFGTILWEMV